MSNIDTVKERDELVALEGHTPGPWEPLFGEAYRVRADGMSIATAQFVTLLDRIPTKVVASNTRLIAAAPDLLATVHRLLDALDARDAEIERLREALSAMLDLQDNASPFGGEMYQDRVDRVFDQCRAALKGSDQ